MTRINSELLAWHEQFAACVRDGDFAGGRALFAPDCKGFGTVTEFAAGLDRLITDQWRHVWPDTRGFHFLPEPFEVILSADRSQACVLALWESHGSQPDGTTFPRRGRCTTLLQRSPASPTKWLAAHTHYSKTPDGEI